MTERAQEVTRRLREKYGSPRLNNKDDPLDELFFIMLSQMTTGPSYERVFDRLKAEVPDWSGLLSTPAADLATVIADAGLANQKAPRMQTIAARLVDTFGEVTLDPLTGWSNETAEAFLVSLPGVGLKTAKCVLMFSLGRKVLPVDTHVERVSRRLALAPEAPPTKYAKILEEAIPPSCRYDYHVNALAHGRVLCRPLRPKCSVCPLLDLCPWGSSHQHQTTPE